jgi:hypothetical protein
MRYVTRTLLLATALCGCARTRPPATPTPAPAAPPQAPSAADSTLLHGTVIVDPAWVCVVKNGTMANVDVEFNPHTGDTTVAGRPLHDAYPMTSEYAAAAPWYKRGQPVVFANHRLVQYGLPRVLGVGDVVPVGTYQGVTVFAEPTMDVRYPDVIYLPVDPQCIFQPYMYQATTGAVRG